MGYTDETKKLTDRFLTATNNQDPSQRGGSGGFTSALFGAAAGSYGGKGEDLQKFFLGDDPGKNARNALNEFGLTGGGIGADYEATAANLLTQASAKNSALNRMSASKQAARAGITGSELGYDFLNNPQLDEQDALLKGLENIKLNLFSKRLQALGIGASQAKEPGLLQSASGPVLAKYLG